MSDLIARRLHQYQVCARRTGKPPGERILRDAHSKYGVIAAFADTSTPTQFEWAVKPKLTHGEAIAAANALNALNNLPLLKA